MKVGTDGVLLGAWANGGRHILDIGTGTGVIALMMAQRFPEAVVDAVDIDENACEQARRNIAESPFVERICVIDSDIQSLAQNPHFHARYDAVVSNPPFFENALRAPGVERNRARHTDSLPFSDLFDAVRKLMSLEGRFSVIIPFDYKERLIDEANAAGFGLVESVAVCTIPGKRPKRFLLAFSLKVKEVITKCSEQLLETQPGIRSPWYQEITRDFYL